MNVNEIFKSSDNLAADDLTGKEWTLTVGSVEIREFEEDGYKKRKPMITFQETEKTFVCNKTNTMMIAEFCGDDTDKWCGRKITLYPTKTDFGGKIVDCIRIRPPADAPVKGADHPNAPGNNLDDEIPF